MSNGFKPLGYGLLTGAVLGCLLVWWSNSPPAETAHDVAVPAHEWYKDSSVHFPLILNTTKEDAVYLKHLEEDLQSATWVVNNNRATATIYETRLPTAQGYVLVQRVIEGCSVREQHIEIEAIDTERRVRVRLYYLTDGDNHSFFQAVVDLSDRQFDRERQERAQQDSIKLESQRQRLRAARKQLELL